MLLSGYDLSNYYMYFAKQNKLSLFKLSITSYNLQDPQNKQTINVFYKTNLNYYHFIVSHI